MKDRTWKRMAMDRRRLAELLKAPKDSSSIHYDEDTIPHGACSDPVRCDCCCPKCWEAKAVIIRRGIWASKRVTADGVKAKVRKRHEAVAYSIGL